ncbi:MAG: M24 family metallopeptidase, partial [Acidobacteriota bacterium]
VEDATKILSSLRQVKTSYEQKILERSAAIASEGHLAGMRAALPGAYEYQVEAAIESSYKRQGAQGPSYPSIVASGPNATILHYSASTRKMEPGDLLLVDSAAHFQYQTVDITRTYPVEGSFNPLQKDIYQIVLAAQAAGEEVAQAGSTLDDIHFRTVEVVKQGLLKLGLITDSGGDQYRTWYTHGACHWIGMDVHDVGDRNRPLQPGMAFVIEPGIYVREGALENLPSTSENAAFIRSVRRAFEKYKNIGVRIEDSYLLTDAGLKRLSAPVPRTIDEVERFMSSRRVTRGDR